MTPLEARDIIFGIFKTVWDPRPALYPDVPGAIPTGNVVWARVMLKHVLGAQSSLATDVGTVRFKDEGTVIVQVFAPVGDGSTACYEAAREVQNAFRAVKGLGVWFRDVQLKEVGSDGAFEQINVSATFSYDDVR